MNWKWDVGVGEEGEVDENKEKLVPERENGSQLFVSWVEMKSFVPNDEIM